MASRSTAPAYGARRVRRLDPRLEVEVREADPGVRAGLALRYSTDAFAAVTVGDGTIRIETARPGASTTEDFASTSTGGIFRLDVTGTTARVSWEPAGGARIDLAELDVGDLCTQSAGGFVGLTFGAIATGSSGHAVFAHLRESRQPLSDKREQHFRRASKRVKKQERATP